MAYWIELSTFSDDRGILTVIDRVLPFEIKRLYYIYDVSAKRGGHRHHKTIQALVCIKGSLSVFVDNHVSRETYVLDSPSRCLIVAPQDWHTMDHFSQDAVLLVMSSEHYDREDYIDAPYDSL